MAAEKDLHEEETEFYIIMRRCYEKTGKLDALNYVISRIYDITSKYGTSSRYPLVWLLFFLLIPSIVYFGDNLKESPFLIGLSSLTKPFYYALYSDEPLNIYSKAVSLIQSVVAIPLWSVFIISLRWNFRKKSFG